MLYTNPENVMEGFIKCGGDGVECDYFYNNRGVGKKEADENISKIRKIAKEKNLIISGGGDFHSDDDPQRIGDYGLSEKEFDELKEFWRKR